MVLDAFASYVQNMLTEMVSEEVHMLLGVGDEIDKMGKLMDLKNFLADADRRNITDESVREWVGQLKCALYEAADILDLCHLKAMERGPSKADAGSRVLVTTRDERVARRMKAVLPYHHVDKLEDEDAWSLLKKQREKNRESDGLDWTSLQGQKTLRALISVGNINIKPRDSLAHFPLLPWLLTPYKEELSDFKAEFNRRHSAATTRALKALSRLKDTWKYLQGEANLKNPSRMINTCRLHNIVIEMEDDAAMLSTKRGNYSKEVRQLGKEDAVRSRDMLSQYFLASRSSESGEVDDEVASSGLEDENKKQE
ncbi:hypothetical protein ZWY2020_015781 [Hordeum vulgare]|nr:hypothetical protein ZWY2020_015781 [Hordeum vulgare]